MNTRLIVATSSTTTPGCSPDPYVIFTNKLEEPQENFKRENFKVVSDSIIEVDLPDSFPFDSELEAI